MKKEKEITEEMKDLITPIVIHEAKSAFYKGKLVAVLGSKGFGAINKKTKSIVKFSTKYIEELKKK